MIRRGGVIPVVLGWLIVAGCGNVGGGGSGTGLPATPAPLLQPFQGAWSFDVNKTLTLWQSQGVPAQQIAQARAFAQSFPLHGDIELDQNVATIHHVVEGEYYFFALHQHNQWVCGKAWHHEDRYDPGDMAKCYVRLEDVNGDLHLSIRVQDGWPPLNDPDLTNMPVQAGSASACPADTAPNPPWSPWQTYVFTRGSTGVVNESAS